MLTAEEARLHELVADDRHVEVRRHLLEQRQ